MPHRAHRRRRSARNRPAKDEPGRGRGHTEAPARPQAGQGTIRVANPRYRGSAALPGCESSRRFAEAVRPAYIFKRAFTFCVRARRLPDQPENADTVAAAHRISPANAPPRGPAAR